MRKLFIETRYEGKLEVPKKVIIKLPNKLVLAMPVQYLHFIDQVKEQLEKAGKKVVLFKSRHGKYSGQILGCDIHNFPGDYDAFFYIGDGMFHPSALLYENKMPVYVYNLNSGSVKILKNDYLDNLEKRKKSLLAKFLSKDNIGLLVSVKPGQNQSKKAELYREKLEKAGKRVFIFLIDEINFAKLGDFNFIDVWINTACPRLKEDFNCLNLEDLSEVGF